MIIKTKCKMYLLISNCLIFKRSMSTFMLYEKIADLLDPFKEDYLTKDLAKPILSVILKATVKNCYFKKRKNYFLFFIP